MMAYHKRHDYSFVRHTLIPGFGLLANLVCMAFYLISPIFGLGTFKEPLLALAISGAGSLRAIYFIRSSKAKAKLFYSPPGELLELLDNLLPPQCEILFLSAQCNGISHGGSVL